MLLLLLLFLSKYTFSLSFVSVSFRSQAEKHRKYISGEWTLDQVLSSFLNGLNSTGDKDGTVTRDEFISYYAGASSVVEEDEYFDLAMRSSYGLPNRCNGMSRLLSRQQISGTHNVAENSTGTLNDQN